MKTYNPCLASAVSTTLVLVAACPYREIELPPFTEDLTIPVFGFTPKDCQWKLGGEKETDLTIDQHVYVTVTSMNMPCHIFIQAPSLLLASGRSAPN